MTEACRQVGRSDAFRGSPGGWPGRLRERRQTVSEWWKTFFDQDYFRIWGQMFSEEANAKQAAELWSMLDLTPGCHVLDAPCG